MADTDGTTYGVWIEKVGWLKGTAENGRPDVFASTSQAVAETAAALYGVGAAVLPMDRSLVDLESVFLAQQAAEQAKPKGWRAWRISRK